MASDCDSNKFLLSDSKLQFPAKRTLLPPTSSILDSRSAKQRQSCDWMTSSAGNPNSSIENPPVRHTREGRESTDSGLASGEANKRRSTDSEILMSRYAETGSEQSSPEETSKSRENHAHLPSSNQLSQFRSRDSGSGLRRNSCDKYLSSASDKAADTEVRAILRIPIESPLMDPGSPDSTVTSQLEQPRHCDRSAVFHRRPDVASLLRHDKRHSGHKDRSSPRRSHHVTDCQSAVEFGDAKRMQRHHAATYSPAAMTSPSHDVTQDMRRLADSPGISSSDTRGSSIRYEPVQTDQIYRSSSPQSSHRHVTISRSSRCLEEAGSEPEDIVNDVTIREEEVPLTSRHRDPSPTSDHSSQLHPRPPTYAPHANTDRLHNSKPGVSYKEQRHHTGIPRMGTGFVPMPTAHSSGYVPPANFHNQQNSAVAPVHVAPAHVAPSLVPVSTNLNLAHEEDESGLWSYSRGAEAERQQFGYTSSAHQSRNTINEPANNTATRFMNHPMTSYGGRQQSHEPALLRRNRARRPSDGAFKKLRSRCGGRCGWKQCAIAFIVTSILLLLTLVALFIVKSMNMDRPTVEEVGSASCTSSVDQPNSTAVVDTPPAELQLQRKSIFQISPGSFGWMQIYVEEPSHIKFNFTISANALLAVYGRHGLKPSHTKFDFFERIDGSALPTSPSHASSTSFLALTTTTNQRSRSRRSVSTEFQVRTEFLEYLDAGSWHLAVFNDRGQTDSFELVTSISRGLPKCPKSCSSNGDCDNGVCRCFHGFQGSDCSQVSCSVTCRGNGVYAQGRCVCFSGWKGMDCATPSDRCIDPDCGGHGQCSPAGECICVSGHKGETCSELDCFDPTCSGHGLCFEGGCRCNRGWGGVLCSEQDLSCISACAGHGTYDDVSGSCVCDPGWDGVDCSTASCRPTCAPGHGICVAGQCRCEEGWTGDACDQRQCDARCEDHGRCVRSVCVCDAGWNGNLCTFAGCPGDCSGHGDCILDPHGEWYCACRGGWKSPGCSVMVERDCGNGRDDDLDTLIDCQDPDCCSHRSCIRTSQCRGGLDPSNEVTSLHGRAPTPPTASFFDRVKFLTHRNGVQTNAVSSYFEPRRASVIRGLVVTSDGSPLVGVTIQVQNQPKYGSTKTRSDGWFDLLVNGGASISLGLQRPSFLAKTSSVFVPWNRFVVAPPIVMKTPREPANVQTRNGSCDVSLFAPPSAVVLASSVRAYTAAECAEKGPVVPEIQAVREAVALPSTQAALVYLSSRATGYKSVLDVQLIVGEKAANLREVYLKIIVEGKEFEKKFEPVSELGYSFEWGREDAYGQKVYGKVGVEVLVGYLYDSCADVIWKKMGSSLRGHDPSLTLASWTLDIQHTYHPAKGVVYLGGGGQMRLLEQPPMIDTVMGDGHSRHVTCDKCDGPAASSQLLSPVSLTSDAQGNVYIGDHDFIRKLDTSGNVSSLFSTRTTPSKYYMAVSPTESGLYFSDPIQKRIFRLRRMTMPKNRHSLDLTTNTELVVGSGATCYPLQKGDCGDGGPATDARLSSPKGLAVDASGRLYFVDGTSIRTVDPEHGTIDTLTGSLLATGSRPLQCRGSMSVDQLELNYPTDLALDPRDGSLFVLDQDVIIKIDVVSRHASLVAGVPPHCTRTVARNMDERDARKVHLMSPSSISVSILDGSIYVAETDQSFIHRIRRVDPYTHRIATVAGTNSKCDCATQGCQCFGGDGDFARSASLHNPIAITVTPDGSVYVADQLNLRIRKVWHSLPEKTNNRYSISNPDTNQLYLFDAHGRHLATNNVITDALLYHFSYSSGGELTATTDVNGNSLRFEYAAGRPQRMILPNDDVIALSVGPDKCLAKISGASSVIASFTYSDDIGLLRSSVRGFATTFYVYDAQGRLVSTTSSTGAMTSLHASTNSTSHTVTMKTIATSAGDDASGRIGVGSRDVIITTEPGFICDVITTVEGAMRTVYRRWTDNSISVRYLDDSELILETKPHPVLGLTAPFLAKRTIQLPSEPLESKIEWKTREEEENGYPEDQVLLGRRMRVNDRNILSLDYSQGMMMEKIYDDHTKFMLRVEYNDRGLPYMWMPNGGITPVNVTYDASGHAMTWQRGEESERVSYDAKGKRRSTQLSDGSTWRCDYDGEVVTLTLPGETLQYDFTYDATSSLRRLTLPSGESFNVNKMVGVGFIRTAISGPDGATLYTEDTDGGRNILSFQYPGEKRKVAFRYDVHGHMTKIVYDSTMTSLLRDPRSGELVSISSPDCTLRFHRNGPLVERHVVTSADNGGLLATFGFTYDVNLRPSSIEVKVNGSELPAEYMTYNDVSGKLTTFGAYTIIDMSSNIYAIGNEFFTLSKQLDNSARITATWIGAYGIIVFRMNVEYGAGGRVARQETLFELYSNVSSYDYYYDEVGSLMRVERNGDVIWSYAYDNDGKLTKVETGGSRTVLRYDDRGRLASCGDLQYVYDRDGFIRRRGDDVFQYDSFGHLVAAYNLRGTYEINYGYDGFGRLSTRVDVVRREVVRYLYADIKQPHRLTHAYNVTSGVITTFRYDIEGHVFALDRSDGITWSVVSDHVGTPIAVLDKRTSITKTIRYSPFGEILYDSNPHLILHIGFRGGIYDVDTRLVHFYDREVLAPRTRSKISSAKPLGLGQASEETTTKIFYGVDYDPKTGQFTSSDVKSIPRTGASSFPLRLYQVNDPVNSTPKDKHMTDTRSWLDALGFKLQNVAPDPQIATRQKDKSSAECQLSRHLSTYMNLQTATPSTLVPAPTINEAPGGAMLAQGLVISIDRGSVATQVTDTATDDVKRYSGVVSGTRALIGRSADTSLGPMSLTHEGKPALYLTKPAGAFAKDKQTMQIADGRERTLRSAYGSGSDVTSSLISLRLRGNEMRAESGYALVVIFYVDDGSDVRVYDVQFTSAQQERKRVMSDARRRAEDEAWLREKQKIQSGLRTRWTLAEKQTILSQGRLRGYTIQQTWNSEVYPEFADSGRNVQFIKT